MVGVRSATGVHGRAIAWGALAIAAGACAALLPLEVAIALFAMVGLAVALLIEPVLGLIVMVCVAPLKVLIETEAPIALPGDIGQWSLALALGVWAVWRASQVPTRPLPRSRVAVALAVIMLGFTPSLFTATSTGAWIAEVAKWAVMLILTLLVIDLGARGVDSDLSDCCVPRPDDHLDSLERSVRGDTEVVRPPTIVLAVQRQHEAALCR